MWKAVRPGNEGAGLRLPCIGRDRLKAAEARGTRGAHVEHALHGRDLGRVSVENVRVEVRQVVKEGAHLICNAKEDYTLSCEPHLSKPRK